VKRTILAITSVSLLALSLLQAQAPSFAVASVKKSAPPGTGGIYINTGQRKGSSWNAGNATLRTLTRSAYFPRYQMQGQIVGGPSWFDTERFDITARIDGTPTQDQVRAMVRTLLADRFNLSTHAETRELLVFALVIARNDRRLGPQMRAIDIDCAALQQARQLGQAPPAERQLGAPPPQCMTTNAFGSLSRVESGGMTMASLASILSEQTGRPVIDRTGLSGYFALTLEFAGEPGIASPLGGGPVGPPATAPSPDRPSIFSAVQDQLGLTLDARREPTEVLIIDRAELPTPN
jgi:uncharacterized protein (TIGR03435 family)